MDSNNILHVFSVPFSINYFVGEQFIYLNKKKGNNYFVSCSQSYELETLSRKLHFQPLPVEIKRSIDPISDIKAIYSLYKLIKQNKIDKIVGHSPKGAMVAMIAGRIAKLNTRIYFRHGIFYETTKGFKRILLKNIDRLSGNLATQIVCVSNAVKQISEADKLNSKNKNIILGKGTCNGVDSLNRFNPDKKDALMIEELSEKYNIRKDDFVVGFVGRIVKDKGIEDLVLAWKFICLNHNNAKLLLIGPLEERDAISKETLFEIHNNSSIILVGNVEDTSTYYKLMDVFILPTYREGFPTVVLEASSMALPVIITKATGCEEAVIEDETGIFTTHNPADIKKSIEYFIENPEKAEFFGKKGREFVANNFDQQIIWDYIDKKIDI